MSVIRFVKSYRVVESGERAGRGERRVVDARRVGVAQRALLEEAVVVAVALARRRRRRRRHVS